MSSSEDRPTAAAAVWLALVGVFFFASYTFANAVTARRPHVGSIVFGWERHIPFLPWTIVPYWTTDLLYAAGMFLCRTSGELHTYVRRLVLVQVICVAGYLLFPLTTWQHHFIDLPTGLAVGLAALMAARYAPAEPVSEPTGDPERFEVGAIYAAAAAVFAFVAWRWGGAGWILLWPAESLGIVAVAYFAGRPDLFRKNRGRIPAEVAALTGPYMAGTWVTPSLSQIDSGHVKTVDEAVHHIYQRRPEIYLRAAHRARLDQWAARRRCWNG